MVFCQSSIVTRESVARRRIQWTIHHLSGSSATLQSYSSTI